MVREDQIEISRNKRTTLRGSPTGENGNYCSICTKPTLLSPCAIIAPPGKVFDHQ